MNQVRVCARSQHSPIILTGTPSGHAPSVSAAIDAVPVAPMPPSARRVQLASMVTSMVCMPARFVLLGVMLRALGTHLLVPAKFALLGSTKELETRHVRNVKQEPSFWLHPTPKTTMLLPIALNVLCERSKRTRDNRNVLIVQLRRFLNQLNVMVFVHPASTNQTAVTTVLFAREESLRAFSTNSSVGCVLLDITARKKYHTWNVTHARVGFMELVCYVPLISLSVLPVQLASTVLETALTKGRIA